MRGTQATKGGNPPKSSVFTREELERLIHEARMKSESVASETAKKRQNSERVIQNLKREVDEIRFFDEIDEIDSPRDVDGVKNSQGYGQSHIYTFDSFESASRAIEEVEENNRTLRNKLKISSKQSDILKEQLRIAKLQQNELTDENASLHMFVERCLLCTAALDEEREARSSLEQDLFHTNEELTRTKQILNESVQRVESLQSDIEDNENSHNSAISLLQASLDQAEVRLTTASSTEESHVAQIDRLKDSLKDAQKRLADAEVRSGQVMESSNETMAHLRRNLNDERERHTSTIQHLERLLQDSDDKLKETLRRERQKDDSIDALERSRSQVNEKLAQYHAMHDDALAKITNELEVVTFKLDNSEEALTDARGQIDDLQVACNELQDEKRAEVEKLEAKLSDMSRSLENATSSLEERNTYVTKLNDELAQKETSLRSSEAKMEDLKTHNSEMMVHLQSVHKDDMTKLVTAITAGENRIQELEASLDSARSDNEQGKILINQNEVLKSELEDALSKSLDRSAQITALQGNLEENKLESDSLRQRLAESKAEKNDLSKALQTLEQEHDELAASMESANATISELNEALSDCKRDLDSNQNLNQSLQEMSNEIKLKNDTIFEYEMDLNEREQEMRDLESELMTTRKDLSEKERVISDLKAEMDHVAQSHAQLEETLRGTDQATSHLRLSLDETSSFLEKTKSLLNSTVDDKVTLHRDLVQTKEAMSELESTNRSQMTKLQKSLKEATSNVNSLTEELERTREALMSKENEAIQLQNSLEDVQDRFESMSLQLSIMEAERGDLENRLTKAQSNHGQLEDSLQDANNVVSEKEQTAEELRRALNDVEKELSSTKSALVECQSEAAETEERLKLVERELERASTSNMRLEALTMDHDKTISDFSSSLDQATADLAKTNVKMRSMEVENLCLKFNLEKTRNKLVSEHEQQHHDHTFPLAARMEIGPLLQENENLRGDVEKLQESLKKLKQSEHRRSESAQITDIKKAMRAAEAENKKLLQERDLLEERLRDTDLFFQQRLEEADDRVSDLEHELLKATNGHAVDGLDGEARHEFNRMAMNVSARDTEVNKLKKELHSLVGTVHALEAENNDLEEEKSSLEASLEMCNASLKDFEDECRQQLEEAETQKNEVEQLLAVAEAKLEAAMTAKESIEKDVERMKEKHGEEQAQVRDQENELEAISHERDVLSRSVEELRREKAAVEKELNACSGSIRELEAEHQAKLEEAEARFRELEKEHVVANVKVDELLAGKVALDARVEKMLEEARDKDVEIGRLTLISQNLSEQLSKTVVGSKKEQSDRGGEVEKLEASLSFLKSRIDSVNKRNEKLEAELDTVNSKCNKLEKSFGKGSDGANSKVRSPSSVDKENKNNSVSMARRNWEAHKREKMTGLSDPESVAQYASRTGRYKSLREAAKLKRSGRD